MAKASEREVAAEEGLRSGPVRVEGASSAGHVNGAHRAGRPLIDVDLVRELIAAVDDSGIDTLEIHRAGTRIRISKTPPATESAASHAAAASRQDATTTAAATETPAAAPAPNLIEVTSPMVGTFYRAPAPEAPPYVEPGTEISKGDTLCILEAMKLMNELPSEVDGIVREILVENADPVEYGQVLFRIEPSGS